MYLVMNIHHYVTRADDIVELVVVGEGEGGIPSTTFFSRGGRGGRGNRGGNRFQRGRGGRGRGGRGRGGSKVGMTAEELDNQLDMYMSKSSTTVRSHLDAELDAYMAESQS